MYYYIISGTMTVPVRTETTDDEGVSVYTTTTQEISTKQKVTESKMLDYFYGGTDVYVSYSDEAGNTTQDALVTQAYIDSLGTLTSTQSEETVVGSGGEVSTQTVTHYGINRSYDPTNYNIEISTVSFTVDSISANGRYSTTLTPNMTGYTLLGVVGWNLTGGATAVVPYQLYVDNGTLHVSLRNTYSGSSINNFGFTVHLMWRVDRVELINLETEVEEEELV